jgi:hypothetical protein
MAEAVTPSAPAREIEIDNADVHAVFTTRGAVLKSWRLKKYRDESNQPLEMIAGHAPADSRCPSRCRRRPGAVGEARGGPLLWLGAPAPCGWQAQPDFADDAGPRAEDLLDRPASRTSST